MNLSLTVIVCCIKNVIKLNRGGSYIASTHWIKSKKVTINSVYVKDPKKAKCQYPIKKHEKIGINKCEDTKALIDVGNNKTLNQIVTELFIKGRKLIISAVFFHSFLFHGTKRCSSKL